MNAEEIMGTSDGLGKDVDRWMVQSYLACAAWSSYHPDTNEPLDSGKHDLSEDAKAKASSVCAGFYAAHREDIEAFCIAADCDLGQVGHDLWLTRNHHGAGFWDRGAGPVGERLTAAAHELGESELYPGDDGLLYLS